MSFLRKFRGSAAQPQSVTTGRFEIEHDGEVAYLEYSLSGGVLVLLHTEVPSRFRGKGIASSLAEKALQYARENRLKVDIICPSVRAYVEKHPEYTDILVR